MHQLHPQAEAASPVTAAMVAVVTAVAHAMIALIAVVTTALAAVMTALVVATAMTVRRVTTVAHAWAMQPSVPSAMPWTTPKLPCASWPARPTAKR